MIVWGRVNLHKTDRKDVADCRASLPRLLLFGDDDDDGDVEMDSNSPEKISWLSLPKFRKGMGTGCERGADNRPVVTIGWGTKAKASPDIDDTEFKAPHCNETKKRHIVGNRCRNQRGLDAPANIVSVY